MIYLDYQASTPVYPEVEEAMKSFSNFNYANPSSSHAMGESASENIEKCREIISDKISSLPSEIIFTSGATESNNLAIKGIVLPLILKSETPHIITTTIEHKCVLNICAYLQSLGAEVTYLKPNQSGVITAEQVSEEIKPNTAIVSVIFVNNEIGTINPIEDIGRVCLDSDIPFHTDAAQAFTKVPIDVEDLNVDYLSMSAHKIGGPKGIGALYVRDARSNTNLTPVIHGAGHELGLRGGTLPSPLIVGFARAAELNESNYDAEFYNRLRVQMIEEMNDVRILCEINGNDAEHVPHCMSITFRNVDTQNFLREHFEEYCISQGSACSSKTIEPSHVLTEIGLKTSEAENTLRISFGNNTSEEEVDSFISDLSKYIT